jgi:glycosyltransferase involved in cell wall biosynthesis
MYPSRIYISRRQAHRDRIETASRERAAAEALCCARLDGAASPKPAVLVYRSEILSPSETFIRNQMAALKSWRGLLVGKRLLHQLPLDGVETRLLEDEGQGALARGAVRMLRRLGLAAGLGALRQERPRLLHAHFGTDAVAAAPIARALRLPMLVTLHGYDINVHRDAWERGEGGPAMRDYPRRLLELAARRHVHFIAVSEAVRLRAIAYGIAPEKLTTGYIGVDPSKFAPGPAPLSERPLRVLFVGRLVEKKGCEYLLRAMQRVKAELPEAEVTIVGDGPLRGELEKLSGDLGVGARFTGALAPERVKAELDRARIFCLPSICAANGDAEGFGLVLLEAQAAGLPAVSSAFGGAREGILHGRTGYHFEEKNVGALAQRLSELLSQPDKAMMMGWTARQFVSRCFDIHKCTAALERRYDQLMEHSQ